MSLTSPTQRKRETSASITLPGVQHSSTRRFKLCLPALRRPFLCPMKLADLKVDQVAQRNLAVTHRTRPISAILSRALPPPTSPSQEPGSSASICSVQTNDTYPDSEESPRSTEVPKGNTKDTEDTSMSEDSCEPSLEQDAGKGNLESSKASPVQVVPANVSSLVPHVTPTKESKSQSMTEVSQHVDDDAFHNGTETARDVAVPASALGDFSKEQRLSCARELEDAFNVYDVTKGSFYKSTAWDKNIPRKTVYGMNGQKPPVIIEEPSVSAEAKEDSIEFKGVIEGGALMNEGPPPLNIKEERSADESSVETEHTAPSDSILPEAVDDTDIPLILSEAVEDTDVPFHCPLTETHFFEEKCVAALERFATDNEKITEDQVYKAVVWLQHHYSSYLGVQSAKGLTRAACHSAMGGALHLEKPVFVAAMKDLFRKALVRAWSRAFWTSVVLPVLILPVFKCLFVFAEWAMTERTK